MEKVLYCNDIVKRGLAPQGDCCGSCHDDEEYGYEMLWGKLKTGESFYVCCSVAYHIKEGEYSTRSVELPVFN